MMRCRRPAGRLTMKPKKKSTKPTKVAIPYPN